MRYPLLPRPEWPEHQDYRQTGGRLVWMRPSDFLAQASPLVARKDSACTSKLMRHMHAGGLLAPLVIPKRGLPDGRHRAAAAMMLGIRLVPVLEWARGWK